MAKQFGLGRSEKLKSRKEIETLFRSGKRFVVYPVRVTYKFAPADLPQVKVAVSVSKKYFKRAVDRNRIKRLLREAYRLQKASLLNASAEKRLALHLFLMFVDKEQPNFDTIKTAVNGCLKKIQANLPADANGA